MFFHFLFFILFINIYKSNNKEIYINIINNASLADTNDSIILERTLLVLINFEKIKKSFYFLFPYFITLKVHKN